MSKQLYYNVPCTLFRDFLKDDSHRQRIFDDVICYVVYAEYLRLQGIETDDDKRFDLACRNMRCKTNKEDVMEYGPGMMRVYQKEACFSISSDIYWSFRNEYHTDEECALFLAWLALKSIIGSKPYIKTNNALWLSRMDGSTQIKKPFSKVCKTYSPQVERYNSLYRCRRLRALLFDYYHVSFYSDGVRGFYFSLTLDMDDLVKAVMKRPRTDVIGRLKEAKQKALEAFNHDCNHEFNHDCNLK